MQVIQRLQLICVNNDYTAFYPVVVLLVNLLCLLLVVTTSQQEVKYECDLVDD